MAMFPSPGLALVRNGRKKGDKAEAMRVGEEGVAPWGSWAWILRKQTLRQKSASREHLRVLLDTPPVWELEKQEWTEGETEPQGVARETSVNPGGPL